jgi:hypothetical protein
MHIVSAEYHIVVVVGCVVPSNILYLFLPNPSLSAIYSPLSVLLLPHDPANVENMMNSYQC